MPPACRICAACLSKRGCGLSGWTSKYCDMVQSRSPEGSGSVQDTILQRFPHRAQLRRQRRQGAEVAMAFGGAVEVGPARREQIELERRIGVAHGVGGAVAAGDDLDAAPAMG